MTRPNEQLIELAAEFLVHDDKVVEIDAELERKIRELREKAEGRKTAAQIEATAVVERMIETGESKKSIADRLSLTAAEPKKYVHASTAAEAKDEGADAAHQA